MEIPRKTIFILVTTFLILLIIILPLIRVESTELMTRTKNLKFHSDVFGVVSSMPKIVNVTNSDSVDGVFSITMQKWYNAITVKGIVPELEETYTDSSLIKAGTTHSFFIPDDWLIFYPMNDFKYKVTPPTKQESYEEIVTNYKSLLEVILSTE